MKRALVFAAAAVIAAIGVTGSTATPSSSIDRQSAAEKILKGPSGKYLTSPARVALGMVARNDHQFAPGQLKLGPAKAASGGLGPAAPSFTNVRVNDPSLDGNQVDQTTQSETSVGVAGSNVVVGYNDSQRTLLFLTAGSDLSGYSYSTDGGATFHDGGDIPNAPEFINFGDPWVASDRAGNMYYSTLADDGFNFNLDVAVAKSTDGGKTWSNPVPVYRPPFEIFYSGDKDAMAIGPDPSKKTQDDIYVAYDDFSFDLNTGAFNIGLPVARSTDGGATWQITYADRFDANAFQGCSFAQYIGAVPIVAKDGTLYVSAEKIAADDPNCEGAPTTFSEWIFKSTDGGQTFGAGVKIADVTTSVPNGLLKLGPGQYMRNLEFPTMAFLGNALYVAWNDGASGHSHIRLAKSTDGGQTWSLSSATQGSNDEVQPSLTGDKDLHLLYYRRNNDNTLDAYVANSSNGASFVPLRVSTVSSPGVFTFPPFDPIIAFGYMGDYIGSATDGTHQYFAWGDNRDTVTNFMWPQGRHDPDAFFAKQ
jgi:BNR/Asp-box repeat